MVMKAVPAGSPFHEYRKQIPGLVSYRIAEPLRQKFRENAIAFEKAVFQGQYKFNEQEMTKLRESFWCGANDQALAMGESKVPGLLSVLQSRKIAEAELAEEEAQKALEEQRRQLHQARKAESIDCQNFVASGWSLMQTMLSEKFKTMKKEAEPLLEKALQKIFDSQQKHQERELAQALSECWCSESWAINGYNMYDMI